MRVTFLAIALFAPALAGCASPSPDGSDPTDTLGAAFAVACDSRFPDPCVIDAGPNDSPSQTEVELAVNPTDPKNVFVASKDLDPLASDAACVWSVGQVTKDAGATWTTVYVGGTHQERQDPTHPLYGWNCVTDPIFEFDDEGVLYYAMQACCRTLGGERIETPVRASRGTTFAYYLAISRDGGETFPREDIRLLTPETTQAWLHDYPRGAVSPRTGAVMFAWTEFHDFPVVSPPMVSETQYWPFVAVVRDAGRSVATSSIQGPDHPQRNYFFTGLVAGPDGAFHAALVEDDVPDELTDGAVNLSLRRRVLATSQDEGATWDLRPMFPIVPTPGRLADARYRSGAAGIDLAADASGGEHDGRLYAAWSDNRTGNSEILVAWSDDRGVTWSEPAFVTADPSPQFMVRPEVGDDGTVHLLYMDRRYDPEHRLLDLTHSWSEDGGATWQHQRVTSVSFDGDLGIHQNGSPFIGDYNGIDAIGDEVWMGFPTTVTGRAELVVARAVRSGGT